MINASNFCHIEHVSSGVNVLFYAEYDGDEVVLHQITTLEIGTFDLKVTMPSDKFEALWPEKFRFVDAAQKIVATAKEMNLPVRIGSDAAPPHQSHLLGGNEISDLAIRAFNEAIDADGYDTSYGCIEGAIRIALTRNTPQGRLNVETLAQEIVRAACELGDQADPNHEDTISIRVQDLEAVANRRITAAIEIASRPATTKGQP